MTAEVPVDLELAVRAAADVLRGARTVVVVGHIDPDGDALGSLLATSAALDAIGIDVHPSWGGRDAATPPAPLDPALSFLPLRGRVRAHGRRFLALNLWHASFFLDSLACSKATCYCVSCVSSLSLRQARLSRSPPARLRAPAPARPGAAPGPLQEGSRAAPEPLRETLRGRSGAAAGPLRGRSWGICPVGARYGAGAGRARLAGGYPPSVPFAALFMPAKGCPWNLPCGSARP